MSHIPFVNRHAELSFLEDRYHSGTAEFIVLYGRRRIGKTELITRFIHDKSGLYILATTESEFQNLKLFSRECGRFLKDPSFETNTYGSYESLFAAFTAHHTFQAISADQKIIMIIDEFPYLIERNPATPSLFQRIWDLQLSNLPIMLILSGSSISIMEQEVLGYQSPLFGRRTGQWQVEPLSFRHLSSFLPWDETTRAHVWFVTGGVPAYLQLFNPEIGFWENVSRLFFTKGAYLYAEAELLLQYEFREPANYLTILKAIAHGMTTMGELINETGLDRGMISKYLSILCRLRIIQDEVPITAPAGSRKRNYRLIDPYLSFWFRLVYPEKTQIEYQNTKEILSRVQNEFPRYCGPLFEQLVSTLIREQAILAHIPLSTLGRWWHKEEEIDLVGMHDPTSTLVCVECKWSDLKKEECLPLLKEISRKAEQIRWRNESRSVIPVLIARTIQEKETLRADGYEVWDLADLT